MTDMASRTSSSAHAKALIEDMVEAIEADRAAVTSGRKSLHVHPVIETMPRRADVRPHELAAS
jgi:hypothetical protein